MQPDFSTIRVFSPAMIVAFHFGTWQIKFWNVIKYFSTSLFSMLIFQDSLNMEWMPSIIRGVKILTKRLHHSLRASFRFDNTKSSIYKKETFFKLQSERKNRKSNKYIINNFSERNSLLILLKQNWTSTILSLSKYSSKY